jgi:homospermidine synthase
MQVAIGVVAAALWMIENPDRGFRVPDDLPHDYVLRISRPYLGKYISVPSDWTPLEHVSKVFARHGRLDLDLKDPWQFKNFLITEAD